MGRLTPEERCKIETLKKAGFNASKIAIELGRHKTSIYRELARNSIDGDYSHESATLAAKKRKFSCGKIKISDDHWAYVQILLLQKWSPEQISGWLKANPTVGFYISDEWIYEYIRKDRQRGGDLYTHLRRGGRPYKNRRAYRGFIKDRISIEKRPKIIEERLDLGHWEVDSVMGKLNKSSVVTLVERVSRYTAIIQVDSKESSVVAQAIIDRIKSANLPVSTITGDNGTEFADHAKIAFELGVDFYFTHPYSSWEKGTNENTNGLIRQYFPKGIEFNLISDNLIAKVEEALNNRPRKCLGFQKPTQILKFG
jgi:IS30 family transposase